MTPKPISGFREKIWREIKNFAVIFLYVWVFDGLFTLHKALILDHPFLSGQIFAFINAFVLAKIILILEIMKVGEVFPSKPPVVRIALKAALFGLLLLAFSVLEESLTGWFHGRTFGQSISEIGGGRLEGMLIVAIIIAVALVPYLICQEIGRAVGNEKLLLLIFQAPTTAIAQPVTKLAT
jgi:hypothetical protein